MDIANQVMHLVFDLEIGEHRLYIGSRTGCPLSLCVGCLSIASGFSAFVRTGYGYTACLNVFPVVPFV